MLHNTPDEPFHPLAVLFDMDGLMIDTERPTIDLWIVAAGNLGWKMSAEVICRTIGIDRTNSRRIYKEEYGDDFPYEDIQKELFRLVHKTVEKNGIAVKPGLHLMLDRIAALGIPAAVATSTDRETALWKLEKSGLGGRFPLMACGDEVKRGKPAPDIFLLAAEKIGKAPGLCAGFEDSPAGLKALHEAGIHSVFIKDMLDPPPELIPTIWRRYQDLAEASADIFG
jgi:HAD superfamily hydrolase (TIGR01509 family)